MDQLPVFHKIDYATHVIDKKGLPAVIKDVITLYGV
jgi:hypothetical protein